MTSGAADIGVSSQVQSGRVVNGIGACRGDVVLGGRPCTRFVAACVQCRIPASIIEHWELTRDT